MLLVDASCFSKFEEDTRHLLKVLSGGYNAAKLQESALTHQQVLAQQLDYVSSRYKRLMSLISNNWSQIHTVQALAVQGSNYYHNEPLAKATQDLRSSAISELSCLLALLSKQTHLVPQMTFQHQQKVSDLVQAVMYRMTDYNQVLRTIGQAKPDCRVEPITRHDLVSTGNDYYRMISI